MYPLKFENLYYDKIWGGRDLEKYRKNLSQGLIGESWDIACHKNGISIISNGEYKGLTLIQLINIKGEEVLGKHYKKDSFNLSSFPLLLKIINSQQNLSVQVHPSNEYAIENSEDNGKIEAWYIIDAEKDAEIIVGTKKCDKETFINSCINGTVEKYMNRIKVKKGDMYFIEAGLLHAIGKGIVLAEIQQNSDTTYRVYDYNRGRDLHIEKALEVINFNIQPEKIIIDKNKDFQPCIRNEELNVDIYKVNGELNLDNSDNTFSIFTCVEGYGEILFVNEKTGVLEKEELNTCESLLIPAALKNYVFKGNMILMKSYK